MVRHGFLDLGGKGRSVVERGLDVGAWLLKVSGGLFDITVKTPGHAGYHPNGQAGALDKSLSAARGIAELDQGKLIAAQGLFQ